MTWAFLYLALLLVGLAMAATSGMLRRLTVRALCHPVTMPAPEHHSAVINRIAQRGSVALAGFGTGGLVAASAEPTSRLLVALGGAVLLAAAATLFLRDRKAVPFAEPASVVRAIPAGGFGQIQLRQGERTLVLAAKSERGDAIPAGSAVELLDCESSVMTVRRIEAEA